MHVSKFLSAAEVSPILPYLSRVLAALPPRLDNALWLNPNVSGQNVSSNAPKAEVAQVRGTLYLYTPAVTSFFAVFCTSFISIHDIATIQLISSLGAVITVDNVDNEEAMLRIVALQGDSWGSFSTIFGIWNYL